MKAIIPAKLSSTRVSHKNWREFHNGKSLVDINIIALKQAGVPSSSIYISSESAECLERVQSQHGVNAIQRDESLCRNETSIPAFIQGIANDVPGDDDIIWSQVCDPLFTEHCEAISRWESVKDAHDSLCVVHPLKQYLMDSQLQPIGWGFGTNHVPSQLLPTLYQFPFTLSILTRRSIREAGYHIGMSPYWYVSKGGSIDIDSETDFLIAQTLYSERHK